MESNDKAGDFMALGISPKVVEALRAVDVTAPLPVQNEAIPPILAGKDVICQAPTGTGKTLAYLLPMIERIDWETPALQVLILAPSRELVMQIREVGRQLISDTKYLAAIVGATSVPRQIEMLRSKPRMIAGTPGRIHELVKMGRLKKEVQK
jgi:superfamily II DNA/RNA helicase